MSDTRTREYLAEKLSRAQQLTINSVRTEYKERGRLEPDFAVQKWLEIMAQDGLRRALADDDVVDIRQRAANVKLAEPTL